MTGSPFLSFRIQGAERAPLALRLQPLGGLHPGDANYVPTQGCRL